MIFCLFFSSTCACGRAFKAELDALQRIEHPNVIRLFAYNRVSSEDARHMLFMEFAKGGELLDRLQSDGPLGEYDAAIYFSQMASAVAAPHRAGDNLIVLAFNLFSRFAIVGAKEHVISEISIRSITVK